MKIIPFRRSGISRRCVNVTYYLIGANLVLFLVGIISPRIFSHLALSLSGISQGFVWQLVTFGFVEPLGNIWTLVFNLLALYFFGLQVEQQVGSLEFALFYLGMAVANALLAILLFSLIGSDFWLYGASGLASGVMLAWASFNPWQPIYLFGIIPLRAPVLMAIVVGVMLLGVVTSGPTALLHLLAIALAWAYMMLRFRRNVFAELFRR